jgi:hypothetical protein
VAINKTHTHYLLICFFILHRQCNSFACDDYRTEILPGLKIQNLEEEIPKYKNMCVKWKITGPKTNCVPSRKRKKTILETTRINTKHTGNKTQNDHPQQHNFLLTYDDELSQFLSWFAVCKPKSYTPQFSHTNVTM